jgi:hypothetical protein
MKSLILLVAIIACFAAAFETDLEENVYNLRHRNLGTNVMCLDLGKRSGAHNMKVAKKKYWNKLIKYSDAEGGKCTVPTKKLKNRLTHPHEYCKNWNKDHVTIIAPEGMRKWLVKEVGATSGGCGPKEDNVVEVFE